MSERLQGKRIVIVGANGGIGGACARLFARQGAQLFLSDRSHEPPQNSIDLGCPYCPADVTCPDEVSRLFSNIQEQWGTIDALLYCGGIESSHGFLTTTQTHFQRVLEVNLLGAFLCAEQAVKLFGRTGGNIVFTASQKALCGSIGSLAYNASKGGLVVMAKSMAIELAAMNIRVNCLCPGATDTKMLQRDLQNQTDPARAIKNVESAIPLGRIGLPEEIAAGALFLVSDESSFMTGAELVIDGGNIAGIRNL